MSILEIILITGLVIAIISIVWSTLKIGISPMPSSRKAYQTMLSITEVSRTEGPIIDLGSGWGTLVIAFAKKYPQRQIIGYELSWVPWIVSCILKSIFQLNNISLHRKNFLKADLSEAAVLLCYLFPNSMHSLKNKLDEEPGRVKFIVSNTFALPFSQPEKVIQLNDIYRTPIYLYHRTIF